jgi:hypothetical protein
VAGGSFSSVGGMTRNNLAAIDLSTGKATGWNPNATPAFPLMTVPITAISVADGSVYVGGSFSSVGGQARTDLAALDPTTGAATSWNPGTASSFPENGHVSALAANGTTVYVGGSFTALAGSSQHYLGAISAATGAATSWSPTVTAPSSATEHGASPIASLALSGSMLSVGGSFTGLGGQSRTGLGALSTESGGPSAWAPVLSGFAGMAPNVTSLAPAGGVFYASDQFGVFAIDAATGVVTSLNHSATPVAVGPTSALYLGPSAFDLGSGLAVPWNPLGGLGGVLSVLASGDRVVLTGSFRTTDQTAASGFAAYATTGPVGSAAPTISGTAAEGQSLTEHHGSWSPAPTSFGYQWLRCAHTMPYPPPCTPIVGASGPTYAPTSVDAGKTIEVQETATNAEGASDPVSSVATATVLAVPTSLSSPEVSGTPAVGQILSCSTGSWGNSPTSYAYQWLRDFEPIPGATSSSYTVAAGDVGHGLACQVTATNAAGSSQADAFGPSIEAGRAEPGPAPKEPAGEAPHGSGVTAGNQIVTPVITAPGPATGPSPTMIAAALKLAIGAGGSRLSGGTLLTAGYRLSFEAPSAGTLSITWTAAGAGASQATKRVTVASGTKRFASSGRGALTLHLTPAGRRLLKRRKTEQVSELVSFAPNEGSPATAHKALVVYPAVRHR